MRPLAHAYICLCRLSGAPDKNILDKMVSVCATLSAVSVIDNINRGETMTLEKVFGYLAVLVVGLTVILFIACCQLQANKSKMEQIRWREAVSKANGCQTISCQFEEVK